MIQECSMLLSAAETIRLRIFRIRMAFPESKY
jgi:hypothetical protein